METICLDTTYDDDTDCSIITRKRKNTESELEAEGKKKKQKRYKIRKNKTLAAKSSNSNTSQAESVLEAILTNDIKAKVQPKKALAKPKVEAKLDLTIDLTIETNDIQTKVQAKKAQATPTKQLTDASTSEQRFHRHECHDHELLAERADLDIYIAENIIQMFEAGNTIPFISRYRKHLTNEMSPEKLREVKESYENICSLKARKATILKLIEKVGKLTDDLKKCILNCRNSSELEHIYEPFKSGNKKSLACRAKALGLEPPALDLLIGAKDVNPYLFINNTIDGLRSVAEVERGLMHIIAHAISTDTEVLKYIRTMRQQLHLKIETKKSINKDVKEVDANNFRNYFNYHIPVNYIKPHQVLAINRGESLKVLSVKVNIPDYAFTKFKYFCEHKWLDGTHKTSTRFRIFEESLKDCYKRLISSLITRQTRSELKETAEKASIEVFTLNLKKLLLGTPMKGKTIMGIDPGFHLGCKLAVVSPLGEVLDTGVIYPHSNKSRGDGSQSVKHLLSKNNCSLIALGNGMACRETETWLTHLIQTNYFRPLDVSYTIVDECGASIYSCSPEAKKEFPEMDLLLVSAVSLARRVQDPLAEFVKVEPKHLGVGMYQHDVNKKALETALGEVVMECVSFVGVDLNTASHSLLRKVAGLSAQRADNIIAHRSTKGLFTNRTQLKDVKGIGDRVFEQCAGFLRVGPITSLEAKDFYRGRDTMPLDCTWVHPESYSLAQNIISKFNLNYKKIGEPQFIKQFQETKKNYSIADLASEFNNTEATVKLIIDVLGRLLDHDLRQENLQEPLFRKGITSLNDIHQNMILTGRVMNVTHFGAFVDIGVGTTALIHKSAMKGFDVHLGDRVEVKIIKINLELKHISLEMVNKL